MKRLVVIAAAVLIVGGLGGAAYAASSGEATQPTVRASAGPDFSRDLPAPGTMLYGETVTQSEDGGKTVHNWQRGQVAGISGTAMTVKSTDGTSWTWALTGDTKIRGDKEDTSVSDIKTGDEVMVAGTRNGESRTASSVTSPPRDFGKLRERLAELRENGGPRGLRERLADLPS
ncbi:hypothetical protein ITP53_28855 [Nonomuraea sp. K274]|uniref:DUF5666 domain-containing protein n=1 Tax=Nonomuraea cypriaca TaxID=1187855 RepID=A0A931AB92_9ACTN|nr:DUF5666 domain-containing protein [Nonomuraea cypriaca]MBF8189671.1 hypothetical protein [Nonomuraea cypriaca]